MSDQAIKYVTLTYNQYSHQLQAIVDCDKFFEDMSDEGYHFEFLEGKPFTIRYMVLKGADDQNEWADRTNRVKRMYHTECVALLEDCEIGSSQYDMADNLLNRVRSEYYRPVLVGKSVDGTYGLDGYVWNEDYLDIDLKTSSVNSTKFIREAAQYGWMKVFLLCCMRAFPHNKRRGLAHFGRDIFEFSKFGDVSLCDIERTGSDFDEIGMTFRNFEGSKKCYPRDNHLALWI